MERPTSVAAVILDMDGLMLDTESIYKKAWQKAAAECGYTLDDLFYLTLVGQPNDACEAALLDRFGLEFPVADFRALWSSLWQTEVETSGIPTNRFAIVFVSSRVTMGDPTHTVVLRLDPSAMEEPDLEVRHEIEKILRTNYPDITFFDDGYGFARHSDAMLLTYATSEPGRLVDALLKILEQETVLGNRLAPAAMVGLAARTADVEPGQEFANHLLVYPPGERGKPLPD